MKFLYIVDYWVPFPSSEYGGVISVIAENDNECYDLLLNWSDEYISEYENLIMGRIINAHKFSLAMIGSTDEPTYEESRIVHTFTS